MFHNQIPARTALLHDLARFRSSLDRDEPPKRIEDNVALEWRNRQKARRRAKFNR